MRRLGFYIAALFLALNVSAANATIYDFTDVLLFNYDPTLGSAGSITGSITVDSLGQITTLGITVAGTSPPVIGTQFTPASLDSALSQGSATQPTWQFFIQNTNFAFLIVNIITGAQSTTWVDASQFQIDVQLNSGYTGPNFYGTAIMSGSLTQELSTPLPAALPLFVTGVGVMGLLGWRRKRKSATIAA